MIGVPERREVALNGSQRFGGGIGERAPSSTGDGIYQLRSDAEPRTGALYRAFDECLHIRCGRRG